MFLPVKRAECSKVLNRIMDMVQVILDYSIQALVREWNEEELTELVDEDLRALFNKKKITEDMKALFQLPYMERLKVEQAFSGDREFMNHIEDREYRLHLRQGAKNRQEKPMEVLNRLCNDLYDSIRDGLPGKKEAFSAFILQTDYESVNGEYGMVCPVCMKENLFSEGEGEVDHYFPRKKYPALALHPFNLLPICSDCNGSRRKHTKNPVDSRDIGPGELLTVFLPYLRPGMDETEFHVSEDARRYIVMEPKEKGDGYAKRRIDNMERLFMLGSRWSKVFSHVYEDIMEELNQAGRKGNTREERLALLRKTMKANSESTKNRRDFIKGVYCGWLLEKSDEELGELFLEAYIPFAGARSFGTSFDR